MALAAERFGIPNDPFNLIRITPGAKESRMKLFFFGGKFRKSESFEIKAGLRSRFDFHDSHGERDSRSRVFFHHSFHRFNLGAELNPLRKEARLRNRSCRRPPF